MCAQAISFARLRRLYYGAADPKGGGVEHGPRIFTTSACHHAPHLLQQLAMRAHLAGVPCQQCQQAVLDRGEVDLRPAYGHGMARQVDSQVADRDDGVGRGSPGQLGMT